jgi:signal transduction histidine kinase
MQIRTKLTLQFLLIGGVIMICASAAIYLSSAGYRQLDFYNRLENKAISTAKLLIGIEEVDAGLLKRIEQNNPLSLPNEKVIILNYRNEVLYSSDEKGLISLDTLLLDRIRLEEKVKLKQGPYEVIGILYTEMYDRFVVIAAASDIFGLSKMRNLRTILLLVCLISVIMFSIAGWFYSGRALKPIAGVVSQVEEISFTSLNLRVDEGNGTDEIARLAQTFNKMLERLETAFKMQKDFISNASHEIRTPLTAIYGQMEVLLMKDRKKEEYRRAFTSIVEDIQSLINLSNRLLLLAQASTETNQRNYGRIRIDEILWQAKDEIKKINEEYKINISIASGRESLTEADHMEVFGDEFLLKIVVSNIIENACKYSGDNKVNININSSDGWITITFVDNGIGIEEKDLERIFEPFQRGLNVNMIPGFGIGLSLVRKIVRSHNGTFELLSQPGRGTEAILRLPSFS